MDVTTGKSHGLAHVEYDEGPQVGTYRVDVAHVDSICAAAFPRAFEEADFLIVDEIALMEVYSDEFPRQVRFVLDADLPLVAAIHYHTTDGFIGEVKKREDTEMFEVTEDTRDSLPTTLTERMRADV